MFDPAREGGGSPPRSIRAAVVLVVAGLCGSELAWGGSPNKGAQIAFGLVGVTQGQSVYLHVSNVLVGPPDDSTPATVELAILDVEGLVLARSTERVARGRSATLVLNRDLLASRRESRLGVRAVVRVSPPPDDQTPPPDDQSPPPDDNIVASLEVVDNASMRTQYVVPPWVTKGFNPQPEPPAAAGK